LCESICANRCEVAAVGEWWLWLAEGVGGGGGGGGESMGRWVVGGGL
jgi:hypothetical protein